MLRLALSGASHFFPPLAARLQGTSTTSSNLVRHQGRSLSVPPCQCLCFRSDVSRRHERCLSIFEKASSAVGHTFQGLLRHKERVAGIVMEEATSVLNMYLLQELLLPLLCGACAFTVLGVSIGAGAEVMAVAERVGLSIHCIMLVLKLIVLHLPSYIGLALPMASLLASMAAFGRMGADNELNALLAGGVTIGRILRPAFLVFTAVTLLHLVLAEGITPLANRTAREITRAASVCNAMTEALNADTGKETSSASFSKPLIYPEFGECGLVRLLYAHGFNGKALVKVTLLEVKDHVLLPVMQSTKRQALQGAATSSQMILHSSRKAVKRVVVAEAATWDTSLLMWVFSDGTEYVLAQEATCGTHNLDGGNAIMHQTKEFLPVSLQAVRLFKAQCVPGLTRAPMDLAEFGLCKSFDDLTMVEVLRLQHLLHTSRNVKESRKLEVKLQQRISLPFACVVFGMVGSLLSLRLRQKQRWIGLALTPAIVFGYYSVSVFGSLIGQLGYVGPYLGAWLPNLMGALVALILLGTSA